MTSPSLIKVAVMGGGVIGVSAAQQLARAGADVILLTESVSTSGASGHSLTWLNSAGIWRDAYHRLLMAAIDRYPTLSDSTAGPPLAALRGRTGLVWRRAGVRVAYLSSERPRSLIRPANPRSARELRKWVRYCDTARGRIRRHDHIGTLAGQVRIGIQDEEAHRQRLEAKLRPERVRERLPPRAVPNDP